MNSENFRDNAVIISDEDVVDYEFGSRKIVPVIIPNRLYQGGKPGKPCHTGKRQAPVYLLYWARSREPNGI